MNTRRGSSLWTTALSGATMVNQYKPGDIVTSTLVKESDFIGVVRAVDPKINKVWVAWAGGSVSQHDPDEIHFEPHQSEIVRERMSSRRTKMSSAKVADMVNPTESSIQTDFLSPAMEELLNAQVGYEFYSAYLYFLAAAWLQSKGLVGFQNWMEKQGHDEIGHGMKVYKYLVDTGSELELPVIPAPLAGWTSVAEVTRAVLDHEVSVTLKWKVIGNLAKNEDNPATEQLAQWFMTEQVEEEDAAVTLHQKVQMASDGSGILIIDNDLKDRAPNKTASVKMSSMGEKVASIIMAGDVIAQKDTLVAWVKSMDSSKSRRTAANPFTDPQFVGDPAEHGHETPISGGFGIMQNMVKQQRAEMTEESKSGQPRMAAEVTKEEWEKALEADKAMLKKMQEDLAKLQKGEKVENLTEEGAKSVIKGLEQTIANKEKLTKKLTASKKTAGYLKEKFPNLYQKAMQTYRDDPLYVAVIDADDMPSLEKAMKTLKSIRGPQALENLRFLLRSAMKEASLRSRRAMYWCSPSRVFRMTRREIVDDTAICPKCRQHLELEPFTKSDRMYRCPQCSFKVPRSSVVVTSTAGMKSRRSSLPREVVAITDQLPPDLSNLANKQLNDIAIIIYDDHKAQGKTVNYAAKPYLEAMSEMQSVDQDYGADSGRSIVAYLLGNLTSWKGEVARAVKKELNRRLR